jgi:hypothetical protein
MGKKTAKTKLTGDEMAKSLEADNLAPRPVKALLLGGAPSKYRPEYCEALIRHMEKGYSFASFGAALPTPSPTNENPRPKQESVCKDTLYEWANVYPEFSDAKKIAENKCRLFWERMGILGTSGKFKNFSPAVYIYNMNNRFKDDWSNSMFIGRNDQVDGDKPGLIDVTPTQEQSIEGRISDIIKKLKNEY